MTLNCEFLKDYEFEVLGRSKVFCPHCFKFFLEKSINKHFTWCSEVLTGRERFKEEDKIVIEIWDDKIFKTFLTRFNKFLGLSSSEFRRIPYSKNYDYWILQYIHPRFGKLPIGLAYVRFSSYHDRMVLAAAVIFPKKNTKKGFGSLFIKRIHNHYKKFGGVIIESPNRISLKIAKKLGIDYYHRP